MKECGRCGRKFRPHHPLAARCPACDHLHRREREREKERRKRQRRRQADAKLKRQELSRARTAMKELAERSKPKAKGEPAAADGRFAVERNGRGQASERDQELDRVKAQLKLARAEIRRLKKEVVK